MPESIRRRLHLNLSRAVPLLALLPVVVATAVAGMITAPWRIRPCVQNFSAGFTGGPTHVMLGSGGNLWTTEGLNDKIAEFDVRTGRVLREYRVPKGTELHDLKTGPDGNLRFTGIQNRFGKLDVSSGKVTLYSGMRGAGNPHLFWARDGFAYISEFSAGRLARFDPHTGAIAARRYNLPPNSGIHGFAELPDGNAWWVLQLADKLARFNVTTHTFDKFVSLPGGDGPHWLVYVPADHAVWVAFVLEQPGSLRRRDRTGDVRGDASRARREVALQELQAVSLPFDHPPGCFGQVSVDGDQRWW